MRTYISRLGLCRQDVQVQLDAAQNSIMKLQQEVQQQAAEKQEALQRTGQAQVEIAALRYAFTESLTSKWLCLLCAQ